MPISKNQAERAGAAQANPLGESSDHSLLRRFRRGEDDAATQLYSRYAKRLAAFAKRKTSPQLAARFDPDDVIQSVFRTFFRRANEGGVSIPPGDELWQLLLVIALNKVRRLARFHRRQRRDVQQTVGADVLLDVNHSKGDQSLVALQIVVEETLSGLAAPHREMIELRIQGHTVQEIATQSQRSRRTVERVIRQFRGDLAAYLDEEQNDVDT